MNGLDALALGIMQAEGFTSGSRSFKNCNPLNLRAGYGEIGKDDLGLAVFPDFLTGYRAAIQDLSAKLEGRTRTGLTPSSSLLDLLQVWTGAPSLTESSEYYIVVWRYIGRLESPQLSQLWTPEQGIPWGKFV